MSKLSEQLAAYIATLATLVLVLLIAFVFAACSGAVLNNIEAFGLGTVTGGLIGLMRGVVGVGPAVVATPPSSFPVPVGPVPDTSAPDTSAPDGSKAHG